MPPKSSSKRAIARSPMADPLSRLVVLAEDVHRLYGHPKGMRLLISAPEPALGNHNPWEPPQPDAPFLDLPRAEQIQASGHQTVGTALLEKGIRAAWAEIQAHLLSAPGAQGWAPRVGLVVHQGGWKGTGFSLAFGVETQHGLSLQKDHDAFLSHLVALDTCLRCVPAPTSDRWWLSPNMSRDTPYKAQDVGAATLLSYGFAGEWAAIGKILSGKMPAHVFPVKRVYRYEEQRAGLKRSISALPRLPAPQA